MMSVCDTRRDRRITITPRSRQLRRAAEDLKTFLYNILFVWFLWLFLWLLLDDAFSFSLCCALKKSSLCATLKGAAAFRSRQDPASPRGRLKIWKCFCTISCLCDFCGCSCGCCSTMLFLLVFVVLYNNRSIFLFQLSVIQSLFRLTVWLQKTWRLVVVLTGTQWFWTRTPDFSQDDSQHSP